jgi:hypothetical protein
VCPESPNPPTAVQLRGVQYLLASLVVALWMVAAAVAGNVLLAVLLAPISLVLLVVPGLGAHIRPDEH